MPIGNQTVIDGVRGSFNANAQNQNIRDVEDKVKLLLPTSRPMQNWFMTRSWAWESTTGAGGKKEWYEDKFLPSTTTINDADGIQAGVLTQTITITNQICTARDTVICEDTDQMFIVTSTSGNDITIVSIDGAEVSLVASNGANLQRLAPTFAEGSSKATAMSVIAVPKYAYPQIIKKAVKMSGTQQASAFYGGKDWKYQWVKKLMETDEECERAWLNNGSAHIAVTGSSSNTVSAGFNSLTTNRFGYTNPLDKLEWNAGLKTQFMYTNNTNLIAMAGGEALNDFDNFMSSIWSITQDTPDFELKGFGLLTTSPQKTQMVRYRHPQGMVDIMYNPQLTGKYSNDVIVYDPLNVKKIYMADDEDGSRKFRAELNIKQAGDDVKEAQYLMHQGLAIGLEETHSRYYLA